MPREVIDIPSRIGASALLVALVFTRPTSLAEVDDTSGVASLPPDFELPCELGHHLPLTGLRSPRQSIRESHLDSIGSAAHPLVWGGQLCLFVHPLVHGRAVFMRRRSLVYASVGLGV
jgi:hypothetical protein